MQLKLPWWAAPPTPPRRAPRRHVLALSGRMLDVTIVRHHLARRYVIRIGPDGDVRLTVPRGASISGGLAFAERQAEWIDREWRRGRDRAAPWAPGRTVWFRGAAVPVERRGGVLLLGGEVLGETGSREPLRDAVERLLRARATDELAARTHELAAKHGLHVAAVAVRNQRSRWGTCSPKRTISLNWRLIQMPPAVSDYVILHELMHLKQPNHSRRFWREVEQVCATWRESERWLRKHGRELQ